MVQLCAAARSAATRRRRGGLLGVARRAARILRGSTRARRQRDRAAPAMYGRAERGGRVRESAIWPTTPTANGPAGAHTTRSPHPTRVCRRSRRRCSTRTRPGCRTPTPPTTSTTQSSWQASGRSAIRRKPPPRGARAGRSRPPTAGTLWRGSPRWLSHGSRSALNTFVLVLATLAVGTHEHDRPTNP